MYVDKFDVKVGCAKTVKSGDVRGYESKPLLKNKFAIAWVKNHIVEDFWHKDKQDNCHGYKYAKNLK